MALVAATLLAHPNQAAVLSLAADKSATHVGACLQQKLPGTAVWQPLGFYSKKLDKGQVKCSVFDQELLACYLSIWHFCHMLEGRQFVVYTDHKLLTHALAQTTGAWTARQRHQLSYVAEFTSNIHHIKGVDNMVVDVLPCIHTSGPVCSGFVSSASSLLGGILVGGAGKLRGRGHPFLF